MTWLEFLRWFTIPISILLWIVIRLIKPYPLYQKKRKKKKWKNVTLPEKI